MIIIMIKLPCESMQKRLNKFMLQLKEEGKRWKTSHLKLAAVLCYCLVNKDGKCYKQFLRKVKKRKLKLNDALLVSLKLPFP